MSFWAGRKEESMADATRGKRGIGGDAHGDRTRRSRKSTEYYGVGVSVREGCATNVDAVSELRRWRRDEVG
jgi:hypothetical protein